MQSSLCRLTRGQHGSIGAATAAAVASIVILTDRHSNEEVDEDKSPASNRHHRLVSPLLPLHSVENHPLALRAQKNIAKCDSAAMYLHMGGVPALMMPAARLMRRYSTEAELTATANEEESLETKYSVLWREPLGEGNFGSVYPAIHRATGERVAVKQMKKAFTTHEAFRREMDAMLVLEKNGGHPNICGMREHFDDERGGGGGDGDTNFHIVLDLISGKQMFEQLCDAGPYSEADAARHIRDAASALAFLHGIGIVHSDLKPENLMFSSQDRDRAVIKLVDFGCAIVHDDTNGPLPGHHHQSKGTGRTPAYCPPEVLLGEGVDVVPSFDMWSLGVVIYVMLIGRHPFDLDATSSEDEIRERIVACDEQRPVPLRGSRHAKHLSEDAISLIEGLLERDPRKRLTAEQVLANGWVQGETAKSKKIAESDKRLAALKKYTTEIGSAFFRTLLSHTDAIQRNSTTKDRRASSGLESAFQRLDTGQTGYLSTNAIRGRCGEEEEEDDNEAKLSYSDISRLVSENMKSRYFGKDHVVYTEGSGGDSMYIISSGTVETTTRRGFKKRRTAGEFFGEEVVKEKKNTTPHSSTVRCVTPCHLIEVPREAFEKYVASDEETYLSVEETDRHRRRERAIAILRSKKECRRRRSYRKGDTVFRAGDEGDNLYILEEGEIDIAVQGHKVRSLKEGEMTGEHAAYFRKPYNVTAQCVSDDCKVQVLPSKVMHALFHFDRSLHRDFRDLMLRRDFKKALCAAIGNTFPATAEEIRAAFDAIDTQQSGKISFERLRDIIWQFDSSYNEKDIRHMLESHDLNKSSSLTWEVFLRIFSIDKEA